MKTPTETFQKISMKVRFCWCQGVVIPQAVSSRLDQTRAPQVGQMSGRRWLWNLEDLHQIADA